MKKQILLAIGIVWALTAIGGSMQKPAETIAATMKQVELPAVADSASAEKQVAPVSKRSGRKAKKQVESPAVADSASAEKQVAPVSKRSGRKAKKQVESPAVEPAVAETISAIGQQTDSVQFNPLIAQGQMAAGVGTGVAWNEGERQIDQESLGLGKKSRKQSRFLPMSRRIDRQINQGKFAYKGELAVGLTASYGKLSSEDTEFLVVLDNMNLNGTIGSVKPFLGYFYRDNRCLGVRFGYQHMSGNLGNVDLNLGEQNDLELSLGGLALTSDSYEFGLFHRSYVGLDKRGRFGLFAEVEASVMTGTSDFTNGTGDAAKVTRSDNFKAKLSFNPGMAVYIFPNVCATVAIGLGGIQYTSVTQRDAEGNKIGSRKASKMQFRINIFDINLGVAVHLWDKKKR